MTIEPMPAISTEAMSPLISHDMLPGPVRPGSPGGSAKMWASSCGPVWRVTSATTFRLSTFIGASSGVIDLTGSEADRRVADGDRRARLGLGDHVVARAHRAAR